MEKRRTWKAKEGDKPCVVCGVIVPRSANRKFVDRVVCSPECKHKCRMATATCKRCGNDYEYDRFRQRSEPWFCSPQCAAPGEYRGECKACGKEIVTAFHARKDYCSRRCAGTAGGRSLSGKSKAEREAWSKANPCPVCGCPRKWAWKAHSRQSKLATCGKRDCYESIRPRAIQGPKPPQSVWVNSRTIGKALRRWNPVDRWRQKCGSAVQTIRKRRHAHHIANRKNRRLRSTWPECVAAARNKIAARRRRWEKNRDPWQAKCESTASNLRKRRRVRVGKATNARRLVRDPRIPRVQVCFDWSEA